MSGFRIFATMDQRMPLSRVEAHARRAEAAGFDGLNVPDAVHDAMAAATVALRATERLHVATSVLVAFPRSPMTVAVAAWDLQEMSGGRFELGLGSQVRGNIVGRYSTPWSPPVPRMREYAGALRAIFEAWRSGSPLAFEGEHYRFTRMQPFFRPDPIDHPDVPIHLGGVGPKMVALAGEVADGLMTHPTNTAPRYLREVVRPRLARGAARGGRDPASLALMVGPLVATGPDAESVARERERTRQLLGFLYSTPSYWPSLELFGWQERGEALHALAREGRWSDMAGVVDDAMLDAFAPTGAFDEIADVLREWYGGLTDWIALPLPEDPANDGSISEVIRQLHGA
ncbi:MAG: TIGR03617 family F420-dependent LLM class oxidoreductase [Myxococcota bacterium]